jgi:hypothetical protein
MIRERNRHKLAGGPVNVMPGDRLFCTVQDRKTKKEHTFIEEIKRPLVVDTVVTFDVAGEFGLEAGIGAVFGKQE